MRQKSSGTLLVVSVMRRMAEKICRLAGKHPIEAIIPTRIKQRTYNLAVALDPVRHRRRKFTVHAMASYLETLQVRRARGASCHGQL